MRKYFIKLIVISIAIGCNQSQNDVNIDKANKENISPSSITNPKKELEKEVVNSDSILTLLQGKWQSTEDEKSIIIFKDYTKIDIYLGEQLEEKEAFILSNSCKNETNKNESSSGKDKNYLSCKTSDMCWHIVFVDKENLTLNYTARGKDLNYKRLKK